MSVDHITDTSFMAILGADDNPVLCTVARFYPFYPHSSLSKMSITNPCYLVIKIQYDEDIPVMEKCIICKGAHCSLKSFSWRKNKCSSIVVLNIQQYTWILVVGISTATIPECCRDNLKISLFISVQVVSSLSVRWITQDPVDLVLNTVPLERKARSLLWFQALHQRFHILISVWNMQNFFRVYSCRVLWWR